MAFSASQTTSAPGLDRAFSLGPIKIRTLTYSVANADTSGTVTVADFTQLLFVHVTGAAGNASAATTYSGNAATLTFVDPTATRYGSIIAFGI